MNRPLTPENFAFKRSAIAMPDRMIRAFNGRGAVSIRDHTVTGVQFLQFTPFEQPDWQFNLEFRHIGTGCVIHDRADVVWNYHSRTGEGIHPLGMNFGESAGAADYDPLNTVPLRNLVVQESEWQPNRLHRTGTFHKRIANQWISFGIDSVVSTDAGRDEIHLELTIKNRGVDPLSLEIFAHQAVPNSKNLAVTGNDLANKVGASAIIAPVWQSPGGRQERFTHFMSAVASDLPAAEEGWTSEIQPGQSVTSNFLISLLPPDADVPSRHVATAARSVQTARTHTDERLEAAGELLPQVSSPVTGLEEFYNRCILTLLESTWTRSDWPTNPFYSAGTWLATLAWDVSFSVEALALLDRDGVRRTIRVFLEAGLSRHSYLMWDGSKGHHYAYTAFAGVRLIRNYIAVTGHMAFLSETLTNGETVVGAIKRVMDELHEEHVGAYGLIDFGMDANDFLENRTDGYQSQVAIASLMYADCLDWLISIGELQSKVIGSYASARRELLESINANMWDADAGWFANLMDDGTKELVWSYHLFDALDSTAITATQRKRLVSHIQPSVFLGSFGMYSIAKTDPLHWDLDDADWGGQYTGMPLSIAERLWRIGEPERAWEVLVRCIKWNEGFPYFPQEIYTDSLTTADVEQPLEIAVGAGVQAVVFGLFGIHPQADGDLVVEPVYHRMSVGSSLIGYRHGGVSYTVVLEPTQFRLLSDDGDDRSAEYGSAIVVASRVSGVCL